MNVFENWPQLGILARSEVCNDGLKESDDEDSEPDDWMVFLISNGSQSLVNQDRNEPSQAEHHSQHHRALVDPEPDISIVKLLALQRYINV